MVLEIVRSASPHPEPEHEYCSYVPNEILLFFFDYLFKGKDLKAPLMAMRVCKQWHALISGIALNTSD